MSGEPIYTVGHSTHQIDEFIELLGAHEVTRVVDVRTVPRSRHNPQFEQAALEASLRAAGIGYRWAKDLGGLRHPLRESPNAGWRNASFRGFADYMQTPGFAAAVDGLAAEGARGGVAIMCAEAVPWRCHRSLIADALLVRGVEVRDILSARKAPPHQLTPFAVVRGLDVTYPRPAEPGRLTAPDEQT